MLNLLDMAEASHVCFRSGVEAERYIQPVRDIFKEMGEIAISSSPINYTVI